jgi:DNA-binding NarL/FixJ family response regulator
MRTVLLVDEKPLIRRGLRLYLEGLGYGVVEAKGFNEAVALAGLLSLDVVVADADLPGTASELVSCVRAFRPEAAVVLLADRHDEDVVLAQPRVAVIRKPLTRSRFVRAIAGMIEAA